MSVSSTSSLHHQQQQQQQQQQSRNSSSKSRARCCISGCNRREGDPGYSFHRFPVDPGLRAQWVTAINQAGFNPGHSTRICSRHFVRSDYVAKQTEEEEAAAAAALASLASPPSSPTSTPTPMPTPNRRRRLYPNAVPSVFRGRRAGVVSNGTGNHGATVTNFSSAAFAFPSGLQIAPLTVCYSQPLVLQQQQQQACHISIENDSTDKDMIDDTDDSQSSVDDAKVAIHGSRSEAMDNNDILPDVCSVVPVAVSPESHATKPSRRGSCRRRDLGLISQILRVALDLDDSQNRLMRELNRLARRQRLQEERLGELVDELTSIVNNSDRTRKQ